MLKMIQTTILTAALALTLSFTVTSFAGEPEDVAASLNSTPELIAKGKTLFTACAACHGPEGKGDGVAGAAMNPKPRNFAAEKFKQGASPAAVFETLTKGFGGMPSFSSLPAADRMALVHYVLSLSPNAEKDTPQTLAKIGLDPSGKPMAGFEGGKSREVPVEFAIERLATDGNVASLDVKAISQKAAADDAAYQQRKAATAQAAIIKPDVKRGQELFIYCTTCHGDQAQGTILAKAPHLAGQDVDYLISQIKKFQNGVRGAHANDADGLRMRPMSRLLRSEQDVVNVAHYISGLKPVAQAPTLGGDAQKGQAAFGTCLACHGPDAKGNKGMGAPSIRYLQDWYGVSQIQKFKDGVRGYDARDTGAATMKGIAAGVDEQTAKDIFSYISTLKQ